MEERSSIHDQREEEKKRERESYYVFGYKNRNDFGWTACMSTKKRFLTLSRLSSPPQLLGFPFSSCNTKLMVASRIPTEGNGGAKKEMWQEGEKTKVRLSERERGIKQGERELRERKRYYGGRALGKKEEGQNDRRTNVE